MGTPKKEDVRQKELKSPTIAEKIRLFEIGKKTGRSVMLEKLPDILEEVKEIILPLVPLLDKQIFSGNEFLGCFVPERFREKRGMCFFSPRSMIIWLERSGKWFVWLYVPKPAGNFFQEADSQQLAVILLQESEGIRKESLRGFGFLEELIFFKDAALYHALIPYVLSCFSERVAAVLKEKEEKLRIMKERLGLLNDFTQSLDPLTNRSERITIKEYSIYRDHKHGTSNEVSGYLCAEALEPFWEIIRKRPEASNYREVVSELRPKSLREFFSRIGYLFDEITQARSRGKTDANSLFIWNSGRLPFSKEEIAVLKRVAEVIKA